MEGGVISGQMMIQVKREGCVFCLGSINLENIDSTHIVSLTVVFDEAQKVTRLMVSLQVGCFIFMFCVAS